jgi:hypothetical protein
MNCPKCGTEVRASRINPSGIKARLSQMGCAYCNPLKAQEEKRREVLAAMGVLNEEFVEAGFKSAMHDNVGEGHIQLSAEDACNLLANYKSARGSEVTEVFQGGVHFERARNLKAIRAEADELERIADREDSDGPHRGDTWRGQADILRRMADRIEKGAV